MFTSVSLSAQLEGLRIETASNLLVLNCWRTNGDATGRVGKGWGWGQGSLALMVMVSSGCLQTLQKSSAVIEEMKEG